MNGIIGTVLSIMSAGLAIYSLLCFIRIILTWIPSAYRAAGKLAAICDPYLNLFRGISWLRFGGFDFSPALALCLLEAVRSVITSLARGSHLSIGYLLAMILSMAWSIVNSFIWFIVIVLVIRLIMLLLNPNSYRGPIMSQFDNAVSGIVYRITKVFTNGKQVSYKTGILISIGVLIVLNLGLGFVMARIESIIFSLPF